MFFICLAETVDVGDSADVRINGAPARVTWRDEGTLVINGTDARRIFLCERGVDGAGRPVRKFTCGDREG